nr:FAD/NAD(P)-binding protein [Tissierella sp.]
MKIAIIGMGVTGISVLREWTRKKSKNSKIELTLFGDEATFGNGAPYQKDDPILIMNQPAELATIIPEEEDDFFDWFQMTQGKDHPKLLYSPRPIFGAYLKDRMQGWIEESGSRVVKEKVKTISPLPDNKFRLTWGSKEEDFDAVHLCMGNLPYNDPYDLFGSPKFMINPFPMEQNFPLIPHGARIGVLGTGLTSLDILRYAQDKRPDLKIDFFSRSGNFKSIRGLAKPFEYKYFTKDNIEKAKEEGNGFIKLETYIKWFKGEMDAQGLSMEEDWLDEEFGSLQSIKNNLEEPEDIGVIQSLLLGMDRMLTDLWMSMRESDKQNFIETYHGKWNKLRSTFPVVSGQQLLKAWEDGTICVFNGLIEIKEEEEEDSFELILNNGESHRVDYIINAVGTEINVSFDIKRRPLLKQLLDDRILQPETFGGVQVTVPELSAISQKYGVMQNFKVHGPLISGIEFGNNSVDIISESAKVAVEDIDDRI